MEIGYNKQHRFVAKYRYMRFVVLDGVHQNIHIV